MNIVPMSVTLVDSMGSDLSVVNAARVSFHKESEWEWEPDAPIGIKTLNIKDAKLIGYLAKHGHWTPFAHAFLSFRIKAPIFVARQLVKHQVGLAWNEVSRRYVDEEPEFWFPDKLRSKPVNAKQGSGDNIAAYDNEQWLDCLRDQSNEALQLYLGMIDDGIAPEQARMILPLNSMTEWIWSGSLMAFARVCNLRICAHAQAETREVAQLLHDLVPKEFEHSWKALTKDCEGTCG